MVGLVVVVILITMGMLFMAAFGLRKSPEKSIVVKKGLAVSAMSALVKTTVTDADCVPGAAAELQLGEDILADCAVNRGTSPDGYSRFHCGLKHSCIFFRDTAESLLEETLGQWGKRYEMRFALLDLAGRREELFPAIGSGCPRERESSDSLPLQTDAGIVEGILYVC